MKWKPLTRLSHLPYLAPKEGASLGQTVSGSLLERAASAVVTAAEPRVRDILQEERATVAKAAMEVLPYGGAAITTYLATSYFVPEGSLVLKGIGYVGAAALGTFGAWKALSKLRGTEKPVELEEPTPSVLDPIAQGLARAVVAEAEPRVRTIIADERARLGTAGEAALPWGALAAAAFFSTMYLIPDDLPAAKMAGYTGTAAAGILSILKGLAVVAA